MFGYLAYQVYHSSQMPWTSNRGKEDRNGVQHPPPGQAGQAGAGPHSRSHLLLRAPGHHISTPTAPASVSAVICTAQGAKCECTRLSSAHGPSSPCPGGQGQPQTDPARHFCKPVHLSDLRERWPPALPRLSFLFSDLHLLILCTSAPLHRESSMHVRASTVEQQQRRGHLPSQLLICSAAFCYSITGATAAGPPTRANSSSCQVSLT